MVIVARSFAGGIVWVAGWGNDKDACNSWLIVITGYELTKVQQVVGHVFPVFRRYINNIVRAAPCSFTSWIFTINLLIFS